MNDLLQSHCSSFTPMTPVQQVEFIASIMDSASAPMKPSQFTREEIKKEKMLRNIAKQSVKSFTDYVQCLHWYHYASAIDQVTKGMYVRSFVFDDTISKYKLDNGGFVVSIDEDSRTIKLRKGMRFWVRSFDTTYLFFCLTKQQKWLRMLSTKA